MDLGPFTCGPASRRAAPRKIQKKFYKSIGLGQREDVSTEQDASLAASVVTRALQIAAAHLGQAEQGGANQGPVVEWAIGPWTTRTPGPWARWCAGFVSTCYLEAIVELAPRVAAEWRTIGSLSCDSLCAHLAAAGCAVELPGELQPGDLLFYGSLDDLKHVGILESVAPGRLKVLEGNSGDAVRRVGRAPSQVVRAARPARLCGGMG